MTTAHVTNAFLRHLAAQDAAALAALFADEIDWMVPGDQAITRWVGPRSRADEVAPYFRELWAALTPGKSVVAVNSVVVDGSEAVIFATFDHVAAPTGRPFHTAVAMRLTVTGDKVVWMHLFEDTAAVAAAFQL
ncbi:nuclear transport factor 2 family protein [Curtobacterium sp. L1-20]|uniref:nuclear transport factor 2 family protein n=1 Tax=Curtobacterium sp. L1-20 TaxID=3138181 RepID=UPI003B52F63B